RQASHHAARRRSPDLAGRSPSASPPLLRLLNFPQDRPARKEARPRAHKCGLQRRRMWVAFPHAFRSLHARAMRPRRSDVLVRHWCNGMSAPRAKNVLAGLLRAAGHPDATAGAIELPGSAPVLPSSFAVDTAAQATIAAATLAANELWRLRTGRRQ